jgi:hypothetical protein
MIGPICLQIDFSFAGRQPGGLVKTQFAADCFGSRNIFILE